MTAMLVVWLSMVGCPSRAIPADPVPVTGTFSRCDPARLGWAAEGSVWWTIQTGQWGIRP